MAAVLLAFMKYGRIFSFGPAGGKPDRVMSLLDMIYDPNDDGKVRILFTNDNDRLVRFVDIGPQGKIARFGPLTKGHSDECRIPAQLFGTMIPFSFVVAEPTGDLRYAFNVPGSRHPFTDTQSITFNPSRTTTIGPGPHSTDH